MHRALRPGRAGVPGLLSRAERALARRQVVGLVRVDLDTSGVQVLGGAAEAEHARAAAARRARRVAGPGALVVATGTGLLVLADRLGSADEARQLAEALARALAEPVGVPQDDGPPLQAGLRPATGWALGAPSAPALLDAATAAAEQAREQEAAAPVAADADVLGAAAARSATERLLRRVLPEGRLRLHHQPVVDLTDGRVVGAEALLRVVADDGTLLAPADLVAVAERCGLDVELGAEVLREACRQLAGWQRRGAGPLRLSVNVSARQLAAGGLADAVLAATGAAGVRPDALVLELTETALLRPTPAVLGELHRLRSLGVVVAVDDFGTGWSSLRTLRELPVGMVKVDRSFVAGLGVRHTDTVVVRAVVDLARSLGLACVAEGVETRGQLEALRACGAPYAQGFLLCPPVEAAVLEQVLDRALVPSPVVLLPLVRRGLHAVRAVPERKCSVASGVVPGDDDCA